MISAYVDESYCDDWFYMVAAIGDEAACADVSRRLDGLMSDLAHGLGTVVPWDEFHGYELFQGEGIWSEGPSLSDRLGIAKRIFREINESGVQFIIRGIDRGAQRRRYVTAYDPYPLVLTHIMQQVDVLARDRGAMARIICDEVHHHDRHRAMLDKHRITGTPGFTKPESTDVVGV